LYLKSGSREKLSITISLKALLKADVILTHLYADIYFFHSGAVLQNSLNINIFLGVEYE
jgi:hypothetical protein